MESAEGQAITQITIQFCNTFDTVIRVLGLLIFLLIIGWHIRGYLQLLKMEKEILEIDSKIDNIEHDDESKRRLASGFVNQAAFERIIAKRRKPLEDKLKTLKMKRQFFLEKLPLINAFRR